MHCAASALRGAFSQAAPFCKEECPACGNQLGGQQSPGRTGQRLCLLPPSPAGTQASSTGSGLWGVRLHACAARTWLCPDSINHCGLCLHSPTSETPADLTLGDQCTAITTSTLRPVQGALFRGRAPCKCLKGDNTSFVVTKSLQGRPCIGCSLLI